MGYKERLEKIDKHNKEILHTYPNTPNTSGIYVLKRTSKGKTSIYVGQSIHILQRISEHMITTDKSLHIDASLYSYGLKSLLNPKGWDLKCFEMPKSEIDRVEQEFISKYLEQENYDVYNVTGGGQGKGKEKIAEFKPRKGWNDGKKFGRKQLAKELKHIEDNYLEIKVKKDNKISQRMLEKREKLLDI